MSEDVLDQVVAILIAGNCNDALDHGILEERTRLTINQRDTRAVWTSFADPLEIAFKELGAANLQALLDDLGGELVHAVLGSVAEHMIDSAAAILRGAMLANMLDAPVAELAMSYDVDVGQYFVDAGTLLGVSVSLQ